MTGIICLQGGRELTPACEAMDAAVLARCDGPVVSLAGAARVGSDYAGASDRVRRHYEGLGADVVTAPDPRTDPDGTLAALARVGLLVLPGGSPGSLRDVLTGAVEERVRELHAAGTGISGASAGAMVLCARMRLPSAGREGDGLGLVPGLALVHWSGPDGGGGADLRWGLPETGGALIDDEGVRAVGQGEPAWRVDGSWAPLPRDRAVPLRRS